jgi:hypothetical protein
MMVDQPGRGASTWSRAAALLARQALEAALEDFWRLKGPGIETANMRSQLLCLPILLGDAALAGRVAYAWSALTRACHHHPYELAPVTPELTRWLDVTEDLIVVIEQRYGAKG